MRAIFWRDLKIIIGAGGSFGQALGFFFLVVFISVLALGGDSNLLRISASPVVFVAALLSGLLSSDHLFKTDFDDGSLQQIILSSSVFETVIIAKILVHWLASGVAIAFFAPATGLMMGIDMVEIIRLVFALIVATIGFTSLSAIGAAITLSVRRSSLIHAIITMPLYIPTLIYGAIYASDGDMTALILLIGISLFAFVIAPWVAGAVLKRHNL